ncbi:MAG: large conductance mechanosensitive channel protein MscL [Selenomonadaceae bacterium]|nr:large conductance mechanosensitive channel protein MscL [Selenomonadaceae bacterium]
MNDFFNEFKKFALRGNVFDLAVGVVIGAAFSKIVTCVVTNIITPVIGCFVGGTDFSNLFINLGNKPVTTLAEAQASNVPVIAYGLLINTIIEFLIIALAVFIVMRQINRMMPPPKPPVEARRCPYCHEIIADEATRCPHCTSELEVEEKE